MNSFEEAVSNLRLELEKMTQRFEAIKALKSENEIEQQKIVDQNTTIKQTIEAIQLQKAEIEKQKEDLAIREKQIVIKEKQQVFIQQKTKELEERTAKTILGENTLKRDQEKYNQDKLELDKKTLLYKKLEESDVEHKARLKVKEAEIDAELKRLKSI